MRNVAGIVLGFLLLFGWAYVHRRARADEVLNYYRWHEWVVQNGDKWEYLSPPHFICIQERWRGTNLPGCNYRFLGHS